MNLSMCFIVQSSENITGINSVLIFSLKLTSSTCLEMKSVCMYHLRMNSKDVSLNEIISKLLCVIEIFQSYLQELHNLHEEWLVEEKVFKPHAKVLVSIYRNYVTWSISSILLGKAWNVRGFFHVLIDLRIFLLFFFQNSVRV